MGGETRLNKVKSKLSNTWCKLGYHYNSDNEYDIRVATHPISGYQIQY